MLARQVLNLIWENNVALADKDFATSFGRLFTSILPLRHAALVTTCGPDLPLAMSDGLDVAPGLPLGDVLVEELPIDLPYDSLVLFLPAEISCLSQLLGGAVAESLLLTISTCALPIERETEALYVAAQAATLRAQELTASGAQIDLQAFYRGMGASLSRYWLADRPGCAMALSAFQQKDFLRSGQVLRYLPELDAGFTSPDHGRINSNLLRVADSPLGFEEWAERMDCVLRAFLGAPERNVAPYESKISALFNFH